MKVLLLANYLPDGQQSMQRFTEVLSTALAKAGCAVRVTRPKILLGRLKTGTQGIGKWLGYLDKFLCFPIRLKREAAWADLVHIIDHSNAGYTTYLQSTPHLVTCHDLMAVRSARGEVPENPTRWTGRQFQNLILHGLNKAQRIVCVSEKTKADLLRISKVNPQRAPVISMGLNYPYHAMSADAAFPFLARIGLGSPYLLHVGLNAWYKNRMGVLRIYQILLRQNPLSPQLVMAGAAFTPEMTAFVKTQGLESKVCEVLSCSNEELRALYSSAELLLFPSFEEGFGWPILEAQACGCRVVTTGQPPMTEVGGKAAVYINPRDIDAAAATLINVLSEDPEAKHARIELGLENATRFSTGQMIEEYLQCYRQIMGKLDSDCPSISHPVPSKVSSLAP